MIVHIITDSECVEINTLTINMEVDRNIYIDKFYPQEEPKWKEFCKKHNFHPRKDYGTKIYSLYLDLCSEGLI